MWLASREPARLVISRLDLADGGETPWTTVEPQRMAGFRTWSTVQITPAGRTLVAGEGYTTSRLYLVEGVK